MRLFWRFSFRAALPLLVACAGGVRADPALSLDEALEVADTLTAERFAAPPRTIADISRLLERHRPAPAEKTRQRIEAAEAQVPSTRKAGRLMKFHLARGKARRMLGRTEEALEDLREAVAYMERTDMRPDRQKKVLLQLAFAEASAGRYQQAVETVRRVLERGGPPGAYRLLVKVLGSRGDLDGMEDARREGKAAIEKRLRRRDATQAQRMDLRIEFLRMEHAVQETLGRWRDAEKAVRLAIASQPESEKAKSNPSWLPARRRELADVLTRQGRLAEAEVLARTALLGSLEALGRDSGTTADCLRMLANVVHAQGRYDEAEVLVREAIAIQTRMGIPPATGKLAKSRRTLLGILIAREDWDAAVAEFDALNADLPGRDGEFRGLLLKRPEAAIALLHAGREAEAIDLLETAVTRSRERLGEKHFDTALQTGFLAAARTRVGDFERALEAFAEAVPILLSRSRQSDEGTDANNVGRQITFVLEAYLQALASGKPTAARVSDAFRIAEAARGQAVQRALGESGARAAAGDPGLADLARREQDARKQIATLFALLSRIVDAPADRRDDAFIGTLRERIDRLRAARGTLMERIEAEFPEYASLVNPRPATLDSARAALRPDEALISTYVGPDRSFVWAVPKRGDVRFAAVGMGREDVADAVGLIRAALEPNATTLDEVPAFDVEVAHSLYRRLLEPVQAGWRPARRLVVTAHGPLGHLPFAVLPTSPAGPGDDGAIPFSGYREVAWLARTHAVTVVPSVASLSTLRALPAAARDRDAFLGFGDPVFDWSAPRAVAAAGASNALVMRSAPKVAGLDDAGLAALPALPDTAGELRAMAESMGSNPDSAVVVGAEATESRVKRSRLDGYRIIAFATHGLTPGELGGLTEPALALTAPRDGDDDGLLTMNEILGLKLDAEWVVLSACNTASGDGAGAEAVSGLGRAFFYAGTRALLVSNWPVQTTSAKALTTGLFRRQADQPDLPRAEALRQSMVDLIDRAGLDDGAGGLRFSYAHPLFWAPFSLIGDGG